VDPDSGKVYKKSGNQMPSVNLEDRNMKTALQGREKLHTWLAREDKVNPLNNKNRRLMKKLE